MIIPAKSTQNRRKRALLILFFGFWMQLSEGADTTAPTAIPTPIPTPTCTAITVDCSECLAYQCSCATRPGEKTDIQVGQLPFLEVIPDSDSKNALCGPEVSGPCRCDGSYSLSFTQLPLKDERCTPQQPGGENRLATVLNCQKQDSYCQPKCANWVQKTCTVCR